MPNSQPIQPARVDDEISPYGIWQILARRKMWIAASVFVFLSAPVYQASVKVRIGQIAVENVSGTDLLEASEGLPLRALAEYGENSVGGAAREHAFLKRASVQKGVVTIVELVAAG